MSSGVEELAKQAAAGDPQAQFKYAQLLEKGESVKQDLKKAVELYKAASEQGVIEANYNLGLMLRKGLGVKKKSAKAAARRFAVAAEAGHADAQCRLARMYDAGVGVPFDKARAIELFKSASENGNAQAQVVVGKLYKDGIYMAQDIPKALQLLKASAEQGCSRGMTEYPIGADFVSRGWSRAEH